ncbi:F0F1 ATP synthase subunit B family protein [Futiania mangrovi]|uniref:ATP synthase subunit b n=1 Tax=Futiania mangrovi TaxID=2959716 RepID=A0A9J6P7S4_9PROT|nr:ATPase [Futiania mangrovii]MCP1335068.1 hypothetical protein [Futiania mangrovii]
MTFDWVTFAFQIVNFLVLLAILRYFLFRPVADMIAARKAETAAAMAKAEEARKQAEAATAEAKAQADANRAARRELLDKAKEDAEAEHRRLVDAARQEAARIVAEAHKDAERTRRDAESATVARAKELAAAIARRAADDMPDPPTPAGYAPRLAEALAAMAEGDRHALLSGGDLRIVAARPLGGEEEAAVRAALSGFAGDADLAALPVETDPQMIAGLELRSTSGAVRNSLAHDIAKLTKALADDDRSTAR